MGDFFVEIVRKNISMNHICGKSQKQITLDDDFIVPDSKPDILKRITDCGEVVIEGLKADEGKAAVNGKVKFSLLYQTDKAAIPFDSMDGSMEFGETVPIEGLTAGDTVKCSAVLEDLSISLINGRKISVSAIVSLELYGENTYMSSAAADIENQNVCCLKRNIGMLALTENKRDILRVREQCDLPANKPNVGNIVWSVPELRNTEVKTASDELIVRGEIHLFAMYYPEDDEDNVQYIEETLPFTGKLPLPGADERMLADVLITPSQRLVSVKPDYDGEPRTVEAELVLDLDIKLYEEQNIDLITDVYSVKSMLTPVVETAQYDNLLIRNHVRCRAGDKLRLDGSKDKILQIISSSATVNVDNISIVEDGLMVEGAAKVTILYISDSDTDRLGSLVKEIPFAQKIDALGMSADAFYTVRTDVEQLITTMLGGGELEIKLNIGINALILTPGSTQVITGITQEELDYSMLKKLPGICGYIAKPGDTLWDIAKKYFTTVEKIMETNKLASENIKPGMKLLVTR